MMVMPAGAAAPVDRLAVPGAENVDVAVVRELLQGAVHGGQAHAVAVRAQPRMQLLGALELAGRLQRRPDSAALPRLDPSAAFGHLLASCPCRWCQCRWCQCSSYWAPCAACRWPSWT